MSMWVGIAAQPNSGKHPTPCHFWLEGHPPYPHPTLSQLGSIRVPLQLVSDEQWVGFVVQTAGCASKVWAKALTDSGMSITVEKNLRPMLMDAPASAW